MTGLEAPAWVVAVTVGGAALTRAALWGKEFTNGKLKNGDGFNTADRECIHHIERVKDDQTKILGEIRDNTRDLLQYFRKGIG